MELEIIRFIQQFRSPVLDAIFTVVTMVGEPYFAAAVLAWIYWNVDKGRGRFIAYGVFTSLVVNNAVKDFFKLPRPIGQEGIVSQRVDTATGHSFPSGHTQNTAAVFTSFSLAFPSRVLAVLTPLAILLVGLSRLYLGVHYPKDVLVGALLGVCIPLALHRIYLKTQDKQLLILLTFALLLPTVLVGDSRDYLKGMALFCGFALGSLFEDRLVNFSTEGRPGVKWARYLLGLVILGAVELGMKLLLPDVAAVVGLRYFLVSFLGMGALPWLFQALHLSY